MHHFTLDFKRLCHKNMHILEQSKVHPSNWRNKKENMLGKRLTPTEHPNDEAKQLALHPLTPKCSEDWC